LSLGSVFDEPRSTLPVPPAPQSGEANSAPIVARNRQLVFDTETTGLGPEHRVIEIGVVELIGRRVTGREFHSYIDPCRDIDPEAEKIHGLSRGFLTGKPTFQQVAAELLDFLGAGCDLIAHSIGFDLSVLTRELGWAGLPPVDWATRFKLIDTVDLARKQYPGQAASLDALKTRFNVPGIRDRHGALIDSRILAQVFLELTHEQQSFGYSQNRADTTLAQGVPAPRVATPLLILTPTPEELAAHESMLDRMEEASGGYCGFRDRWQPPAAPTGGVATTPPANPARRANATGNSDIEDWTEPFADPVIEAEPGPRDANVSPGPLRLNPPGVDAANTLGTEQGLTAFSIDL
jgi:DNA polymerase-3 subunit epsilon